MRPLKLFLLFAAAMLISVAALPLLTPAKPACRLQVIRDYTWGAGYKAELRRSAGCPWGTMLRIRKSSTTSLKAKGAPYQPIQPLVGAWEIGEGYSTVPDRQRWTLYSWRWEYWRPSGRDGSVGGAGKWLPAEVLP